MVTISDNLATVKWRISAVAERCGRAPDSIRLIAVSKGKPASAIREAFEAGQRAFGENYAQEMAVKAQELADLSIEWHFIGHLQRNKAKLVTPIAACVETVDSIELARALDSRAGRAIKCLAEVNIGGEETKSGVNEAEVILLARQISEMKILELMGLMAMPPYDPDPEKSRPYFKKLAELLARLNEELKLESPLRGLSMGMSHDLEVAIEEGATIVRVGTAIFGER